MVYKFSESKKRSQQSFSTIVDEFAYDDVNDSLVVVGKIDLQEKLQSFLSCALDKILDKFLDESNIIEDNINIFDNTENISDLAQFGDVIEKAEYYRNLFNLPSDLSYDKVFEQAKMKLDSIISNKSSIENNNVSEGVDVDA